MWIGVKFQSNPEIAGSPRNSFRASLGKERIKEEKNEKTEKDEKPKPKVKTKIQTRVYCGLPRFYRFYRVYRVSPVLSALFHGGRALN